MIAELFIVFIVVAIILIFLPVLLYLLPLIMIAMFCGMFFDPKFHENRPKKYIVRVFDNTPGWTTYSQEEWEAMVEKDPRTLTCPHTIVYLEEYD